MKITKYYNKEKDRYFLFFEEALYVTLFFGKWHFRHTNEILERDKDFIPFDRKRLENFFFQEFLENFFHHYYEDAENTVKSYEMLHIKMNALVQTLSTCILWQKMDEGDEEAEKEDEKFICLFEIDEIYKPSAKIISKENFKKILNFLGREVVLKDKHSFSIEFFFKEEEPLKGAEPWEPKNPEVFIQRYPIEENLASKPHIFTKNFRNCDWRSIHDFTLPVEIKEEILKMLNNK